jgi:hypothetical protein
VVRSVVGIVFGVLVIAALVAMANAVVFHGTAGGSMPAPLEFMLLLMHALAAIAGGYLGAAIARRRPGTHGLAVGVLYLLAVQFAPTIPARLIPTFAVRPLWLTALGIAVGLVGAVVGGIARGQADGGRPAAEG